VTGDTGRPAAIDAATFANLLEMTGGDIEFVDDLVDTYLDEGVSLIERLRTAAAAGDGATGELLRAAHSLKSSSLNVGALPLGELCRALEADARGGPVADAGTRVDAIASGFDDARAALLAEREGRRAPD
jgi:HPt (histidine-containing phosphotransfer) domain-containing protein